VLSPSPGYENRQRSRAWWSISRGLFNWPVFRLDHISVHDATVQWPLFCHFRMQSPETNRVASTLGTTAWGISGRPSISVPFAPHRFLKSLAPFRKGPESGRCGTKESYVCAVLQIPGFVLLNTCSEWQAAPHVSYLTQLTLLWRERASELRNRCMPSWLTLLTALGLENYLGSRGISRAGREVIYIAPMEKLRDTIMAWDANLWQRPVRQASIAYLLVCSP